MSYPTFDIVFKANGLVCSTEVRAANWEAALKEFWGTLGEIDGLDVEILSINGVEPYEW